jgi:uncharacterized protein (DUF2141 family)
MKRKHYFSLFLMVFSFWCHDIQAQNIKVKVQNLNQKQGIVHARLCRDTDDFLGDKFKELASKISPSGEAEMVFNNIPTGKYVVWLYQDTDNSGDLTINVFGIPTEPFGFSNNPRIKIGPPAFSEASFDVKNDVTLTINLRKLNL